MTEERPIKAPWKRRPAARPLADLVGPSIADLCGKAGFSAVEIVTHWDEIVGPALAPRSTPVKLQWPRQDARQDARHTSEPATLVVRVEGAYAIELQYAAPVVIDRINAYFGWRCVGRLVLRQGPVPPRHHGPPPRVEPEPEALAQVRATLGPFEDEALGASLARLGALVRRARRKS
ncbi:DUF721 domain-containing protein [Roseixanthobacter liquoris]|uniref:DUF721 domain-containing protein n=1 Tax=Roseixanthobacter liquoris TaxID=3119921 RepID=UPI00372660BA